MDSIKHIESHPKDLSFGQGLNHFSDMTDDEWLETYANKVMEESYKPRRPMV